MRTSSPCGAGHSLHLFTRHLATSRAWRFLRPTIPVLLLLVLVMVPWLAIRSAPELHRIPVDTSGMAKIAFLPSTDVVAIPSFDGTVRLVDAASGGTAATITLAECRECDSPALYGIAVRPDGAEVVVTGEHVTVLDLVTRRPRLTLPADPEAPTDGRLVVGDVAWSADGSRFATLGLKWAPNVGIVCVYDARSGQLVQRIATGRTPGEWPAISMDLSPDGTWIASANNHNRANLWKAASGRHVRTLQLSPAAPLKWLGLRPHAALVDWTTNVAFSPDSTRVAVAGSDATAGIWKVATGRRTDVLHGHTDEIMSLTFSPDGSRIATLGDDETVRIWAVGP